MKMLFVAAVLALALASAQPAGATVFPLGGGGFGAEYFTVSTDTNQLTDALVSFIATPFTQG
jgi:hypothetical protein